VFNKINLDSILKELEPYHAKLVAVSKKKPASIVSEAINAGQLIFGENYVQELVAKQAELPPAVQWHFIGHLQSNKVKQIVPFISMVQGVDSIKLLKEIDKEAGKCNRVVDCLLQVHIAQEETKFGFDIQEAETFLQSDSLSQLKNIRLCGLMGMASLTGDTQKVRDEFRSLKKLFDEVKQPVAGTAFTTLSMGMTSDYKIALEEGSNMIRIGSALFGER